MALSPAEKPESKAAAMPAPSAVGATAAPAKSKTDPPAGGFGSKSIVLFSISLFVLGFSGSYINGRNSYNVRDRVLTDATFGTVGGECEAGVCLSDESRIGEDSKDSSDEEEYSTFGEPPTVDTVGGEFEAVVDEAEEASSDDDDDEDEDSSDDEADPSYVEGDTVGGEGAALSMTLLGEEAMVLDDKKSKGGGCCTDSSRRLKTDISVIGNSPSGIKIYQFRYKRDIVLAGGRVLDSDSTFVGTMAEELLGIAPDAVVFDPIDGYYVVDYSKIDVDFYKI